MLRRCAIVSTALSLVLCGAGLASAADYFVDLSALAGNTVALARHCEALGYQRFWVSEHHNHPTIVGTAPEIVMAAIAATTERIRSSDTSVPSVTIAGDHECAAPTARTSALKSGSVDLVESLNPAAAGSLTGAPSPPNRG